MQSQDFSLTENWTWLPRIHNATVLAVQCVFSKEHPYSYCDPSTLVAGPVMDTYARNNARHFIVWFWFTSLVWSGFIMIMVLLIPSFEIRIWLVSLGNIYRSSNSFYLYFETRPGLFSFILWWGLKGMRSMKGCKDHHKNSFFISQRLAKCNPWAKFVL